MPNRVRILTVPDADRAKLERRARDRGAPARVAERARIVLLAAEGLTGPQIAERVGCTEPTVIKWRRQYAEDGLAGLEDAPRPGGPRQGADRAGDQRDPVRDGDPAAGCPAAAGVTHWSSPAAGRVAAPVPEDRGQPRLDHPAVAPVLPAAAPQRGVQVLHRPAAGRQGPRRRRPLPAPPGQRRRGVRGREIAVPGPGADPADPADAQRHPRAADPRLRPARGDLPVRRPRSRHRARSPTPATPGTATRSS